MSEVAEKLDDQLPVEANPGMMGLISYKSFTEALEDAT